MPSSSPMFHVCSASSLVRPVSKRSQGTSWRHWLAQHRLSRRHQSDKSWRPLNRYFTILAHGFQEIVFFFQCYYPKFEIFYKTMPFVILALIVKHSYFRPGKQSSWYRTLKNNAIHLNILAMVLRHQLLASPPADRAKHIFSTKGKRTKFSSTNCNLVA